MMKNRITPDNITSLKDGEIFVFGSNERGGHGRGAAYQAMKWGAKWGQASGLQGRTYGIPTKDKYIKSSLSVKEIDSYVKEFISFAKSNPHLTFLVTEIGCGLAKHSPKDIAPLFSEAININNVHLPDRFWKYIVSDTQI